MSEYIYGGVPIEHGAAKGETRLERREEITRCRDCKYIIRHETANSGAYFACGYFDAVLAEIEPDGFCAWGVRRDA